MHRAIVLSMIAVLSTASSAVAKKGGPLPRLDPRRDAREFQRKLTLAQDLHAQHRCGAAYPMYLELQTQQPQNPDVLWGLGECGRLTAQYPELGQDAQRQRALDAKAAFEAYVAAEKRSRYTSGSNNRVALARERAAQLDAQIAALPAPVSAVTASAADAREFPRQKGTLPLCGMQAFWDPGQGLNPGFAVELFALLHANPELRVMIWLPSNWNDRARQLFRTTNDLSLQDQGFRDRHGFKPAVLREFATYESRVGFIGVAGAEQQPGRVTLHHPNGIDVTVVRCDAVRGALAWAVEEKQRQAVAGVGAGIRPADRLLDALAIAGGASPATAAAPLPTPPLPEGGGPPAEALAKAGEGVGAPPPAEPPPAAAAAPAPVPAPVADAAPPAAAVAAAPPLPAEALPPVAAAPPPPAPVAPARAEAEQDHAEALRARAAGIQSALDALTSAMRANPKDLALQEQWVLMATLAQRCADVMPVYLRIAEGSKNPKVHRAGAACAEELKQPRETFLALERYVRTSPRWEISADTYRVIAEGFVDLKERGRARHHYEQFLALADRADPHRADAERFVRARTDCFIQRGVATAALTQVGDRWVVQVRIPPNALEQAPACGE